MAEALSQALRCVHRIMAITSAFQADDAGSIPAARSNSCSKVLLMQTPPSDEMKQAKKAFKASLKSYLAQFDEKNEIPDVSEILNDFKPVIFQESVDLIGKNKTKVAQTLNVNRGVLSKVLQQHPKPTLNLDEESLS